MIYILIIPILIIHYFLSKYFLDAATWVRYEYGSNQIINKLNIGRYFLISLLFPIIGPVIGYLILSIHALVDELIAFPWKCQYIEITIWIYDTIELICDVWGGDYE